MYDAFYPGQVWLDTEGKRIHAHGGSIITVNGMYYLYGENKERSLPGTGIWHWGVRLYSSTDLYNWKDEGLILPPAPDPAHPLHHTQYMDRPHIIYNEKTKKFVMWCKIMNKDYLPDQIMTISVADHITDQFQYITSRTILGMSSGDFDLTIDPDTVDAYIFFDKVHDYKDRSRQHTCIVCAKLTEDFTDVTGEYVELWGDPNRFLGREAPAFFTRNGKKYLLSSSCTGYFPNATECMTATDYFGPWKDIGTVHIGDTESTSFRSQISSVFPHPEKKDLYIALGDRWLVDLPKDLPKEHTLSQIILHESDPSLEPLIPKEEWERIRACNLPHLRNTSIADYVWLPITFNDDKPEIRWCDSWRIEDFE